MFRALLRRSVLAIVAAAGLGGNEAAAQSFDANIVSRVESFIPTSPETVLPTKTKKVPVKRKEQYSVTVEEKKELSTAEREAKAKEMGVVVPLGLRSTTARKAYLNLRNVPTYRVIKVRKQKTRVITEIVEKKVPRKTVVRGIAAAGYSYATNANQANIDIIPDSIGNQSGNLLVLVPAGREEDTVSFLLGPSAVRYATLDSSSFDALNGSITYTRLLGRRQTASGLSTGGTARTDLLTIGLDGISVYEPGFGANQIVVATPSIGWSRSNIGLGNRLCGDKGSEAYCYYADISVSLSENVADIHEPDQQQRFHRGDARLAAAGQEPVAVSDGQPARGLFLRLSRRPPGSRLCRQRQPQLEPEGECDAGCRRQVHPAALHAVRPRLERVHRLSPGRAQYEVLVRRRDRPGSICC